MRLDRLLGAAAAAALIAGSALAQTSSSGSAMGAGSTQPSTGAPGAYAPPPTTGGAPQPSAGANSMGGMGSNGMAATSGSGTGAMGGAPGAFTPVRSVPGANIIATLKASGQFTKLLAGLDATNLTSLIATHPSLTLFAPTDAAFAQLPPGQLDTLMKSPTQLQAILAYHLIATTIKDSDVKGHAAGKVQTAANKPVTIDGSGPAIKVDTASVLQPGVTASNGVIYPIDKVLMPMS